MPSFCAEDLSHWVYVPASPFVSKSVATRALRPAITGLQRRLCDCVASTTRVPPGLRFVFTARPNLGQTEVKAGGTDALDPVASCVGEFVAAYPRFEFDGDDFDCPAGANRCTSPPASFVAPLQVDLERI
jgi:hypothetical protein